MKPMSNPRRRLVITGTLLCLVLGVSGCKKSEAKSGDEISLDELNRGLATWRMAKGSPPANIFELTNLPALKGRPWPQLPPDKTLVLDKAKSHIVIESK